MTSTDEILQRLRADMVGSPITAQELYDVLETTRALERESIAVMLDRMTRCAIGLADAADGVGDCTAKQRHDMQAYLLRKAAAAVRARGLT